MQQILTISFAMLALVATSCGMPDVTNNSIDTAEGSLGSSQRGYIIVRKISFDITKSGLTGPELQTPHLKRTPETDVNTAVLSEDFCRLTPGGIYPVSSIQNLESSPFVEIIMNINGCNLSGQTGYAHKDWVHPIDLSDPDATVIDVKGLSYLFKQAINPRILGFMDAINYCEFKGYYRHDPRLVLNPTLYNRYVGNIAFDSASRSGPIGWYGAGEYGAKKASGRYQIQGPAFDTARKILSGAIPRLAKYSLSDRYLVYQKLGFSPLAQDATKVALLAYRGSVENIKVGNWTASLDELNSEWACLPGSEYGQPGGISRQKFDEILNVRIPVYEKINQEICKASPLECGPSVLALNL